MTAPDGAVRIALNVAPGPGGHDLPWQHVALATGDIVATARRLRDLGAPLLPIPGNYYDDRRWPCGSLRHRRRDRHP
ncbi:MAG: 4-hydroxyphenylpyruvate dioxygenase, partial [Streptomycetaceae bacterium]|nr:4-hydroxyphenylpyruvate dioxygenase [Streptomycetaceae bacterium]